MNGAEAVTKCLAAEGISRILGYPGVATPPFPGAVFQDASIGYILVRQEQATGHAASGYARITGRPAVYVSSSGPGVTNLITAPATTYTDSIPLIAITGQVNFSLPGRNAFQEANMRGATESFVKYSHLVKNADETPRVSKEAFYIANSGRKGSVLIDIPIDVQMQTLKKPFAHPEQLTMRDCKPNVKGNSLQLSRVIAVIQKAKKPLVYAGDGVILGQSEAGPRAFCEKYRIPFVHTMMGIGVLPKNHPLYFGMFGNNGEPYANRVIAANDLLIIVGVRIADRAVPKPEDLEQRVNIIHIDIDTAEIGKNLGPTIPPVDNAKVVFAALAEVSATIDTSEWLREPEEKKHGTVDLRRFSDELVDPVGPVKLLSEKMEDDTTYVADAGQNQLWSVDSYVMKRGCFLTSGSMDTMGYSIPATIGTKFAAPKHQVVAVCGDGSFQMFLYELDTIVVQKLPVKVLIMKNRFLGLVRECQAKTYSRRYEAVRLFDYPRYSHIATAYDMVYFHCDNSAALGESLDAFLAYETTALMVCDVDSENNTQ